MLSIFVLDDDDDIEDASAEEKSCCFYLGAKLVEVDAAAFLSWMTTTMQTQNEAVVVIISAQSSLNLMPLLHRLQQ